MNLIIGNLSIFTDFKVIYCGQGQINKAQCVYCDVS